MDNHRHMSDTARQIESDDNAIMTRYDRIADIYDRERHVSEAQPFINRIEIKIINKWIGEEKGCLLLDIPCGTGRLTTALAGLCQRLIAGDVSAGMIDVAKNKMRSGRVKNVTLLRVNSRRLPFLENTFDVVLCVNLFHLLNNNDKPVFMDEFKRILKPRGKLILENVSPVYGQLDRLRRRRISLREIRAKLVLPGMERRLYGGFRKRRELGFGFPLFSRLASVFGESAMMKITLALGTRPVVKLLGYTIITELEKEPATE